MARPCRLPADGSDDHIKDVRSHRISLVAARDVVSAVLAVLAAGPALHGEVLHIAQEETPTIAEYYEAVAQALEDSEPAAEGEERRGGKRPFADEFGDGGQAAGGGSFTFGFGSDGAGAGAGARAGAGAGAGARARRYTVSLDEEEDLILPSVDVGPISIEKARRLLVSRKLLALSACAALRVHACVVPSEACFVQADQFVTCTQRAIAQADNAAGARHQGPHGWSPTPMAVWLRETVEWNRVKGNRRYTR